MASLVSFMMLLEAIALVASNPVITPRPTITAPARIKRSLDIADTWTGWYEDTTNGEVFWTSYTLKEDYVMVSTSNAVFLCDTTQTEWESSCSASFPTACTGTTAYFLDGGSSTCADTCNADTVFTSNTMDANAKHWYGCVGRNALLVFEVEPTSTETPSPTTTPTTSPDPTTTPTPGPSTTPTPSPTSSPVPADSQTPAIPKTSASKAWVAGPVIGGLAAAGIVGLLFFFFRRRKQNAESPAYQPAPQMQSPHSYQSPSFAHTQNATSPNMPSHMDPNGYYGHQVTENKPDNLSVYSHTMPVGQAFAPTEGTMRMPAGVSEYHGAESQDSIRGAAHMAPPVSELSCNSPTHDLPELASTTNAR